MKSRPISKCLVLAFLFSVSLFCRHFPVTGDGTGSPVGYWKNGHWVGLPLPYGVNDGWVSTIFVSGSDVYAAGSLRSQQSTPVGYWKNGRWVQLGYPGGFIKSLVLSDSVVFAAGAEFNSGYWKKGKWHDIGQKHDIAKAIAISAGNFLIGGAAGGRPGYWKNGNWIGLPAPWQGGSGEVDALAVSGDDVYAAGGQAAYSGPGYWKNQQWISLPNAGFGGTANAIVAAGTDVYVGGFIWISKGVRVMVPGYWKNGIWVALPPGPGERGYVTALAVTEKDVYAGGAVSGADFQLIPGIWKNGRWKAMPRPRGNEGNVVGSLVVSGENVFAGGARVYQFSR